MSQFKLLPDEQEAPVNVRGGDVAVQVPGQLLPLPFCTEQTVPQELQFRGPLLKTVKLTKIFGSRDRE